MKVQKTDNSFFIIDKSEIFRKDNNLYYHKFDEDNQIIKTDKIPINAISELYLLAKTKLDTEILSFLADNNVVVHIFNSNQTFKGNFFPSSSKNSINKSCYVFLKQLETFKDLEKRLNIAKEITKGHLHNILKNLQKYNINHILNQVEINQKIDNSISIDELMGVEGNFQKIYYSYFNKIIKNQRSFKFTERSRRPPLDKLNSFISYMNTRVYNICLSEIYKTELDPRISFLHEPNSRYVALHLDIAEIFKPIIADTIIFSMLNNNEITTKSFEVKVGLIRFKRDDIQKIELKIINKMYETIKINNQTLTLRQLIRREVNQIKKYIIEDVPYKCFKA